MQVEFRRDDGRLIGRVDFFWERDGLVGECDGRMKYADADSIYREKRREDELRSLGLGMVRWGWPDLKSSALASRLRRIVGTS
jgi:very-short-patch-repair endonuclease